MFNKFNHTKINIILPFLLIYLLIGTLIFDDYGLSWDETYHRINGFVALNSIRDFLNLDDEFLARNPQDQLSSFTNLELDVQPYEGELLDIFKFG